MNVKRVNKKLSLKRLTIWNLDINHDDAMAKDEQKVIKAGSDNTNPLGVGVTEHPKYC